MKTCTKCGATKDDEAFALEKKRGKRVRRSDCRACRKAYLRDYYAKNGAYFKEYRRENSVSHTQKSIECHRRSRHERYAAIRELKSNPCLDCGTRFSPHVMDFDHRDPATKVGEISPALSNSSHHDPEL